MTSYRSARVVRPVAAAILAAFSIGGVSVARASESAVGQVSLLIGEARVVRADGSREVLHRGASIQVGDRIETAANGHVHVRFIDNAAVSVRPESVLEVQAYRYDAQRPQSNEVRLRVEQGTSRSISGAATELDKTRFRLNTPIAAIGVRGTDFIVQTDASGVRATVADGAIVVGALGAGCSAAGLGPCGGSDDRVLSADMGRVMAELKPGDRMARLVPTAGAIVATASVADDRASARAATAARSAGLSAAEPTPSEHSRGNDRTTAELLTLASVTVADRVALTARAADSTLIASQLVWGRWGISAAADDSLSVPFALARLGRHVTVADDSAGLFRTNPTQPGQLLSDSLNASVEFRLTRANVTYESGTTQEAASVSGRNLTIDFGRRTFATALALASSSGVKTQFTMDGVLRSDGLFARKVGDDRIAGAVSLDGKEAGYLFERGVGGGATFRGKTLWGN
ncbi:FecR domain-containing protein [Ideonella sp. A 288]|uniref:FecR family protein n=1 Tax=Ideonella sp. A 288 TaxID=1962181 RepID=UPI001303DC3D|nr:FecR family protein [Ideonella sp. A 288]